MVAGARQGRPRRQPQGRANSELANAATCSVFAFFCKNAMGHAQTLFMIQLTLEPMLKNILYIGSFLLLAQSLLANPIDTSFFQTQELQLAKLGETLLTDTSSQRRQEASSLLALELKTLLEKKGSFQYTFKKLKAISVVQPPSNTFKIFTWQVYIDQENYSHVGFIQKADGSVFELKDQSDNMAGGEMMPHTASFWYGALYYNLKEFKHKGQKMYLLMGADFYSFFERRKVLEVLYFDVTGSPRFGKKVIQMKDGFGRVRIENRMFMQYAASVNVSLNYKEDLDMVVYDHLILGAINKQPANLPDGSYSGMKLNKKGIWTYVDKVYKDDPNNVLTRSGNAHEIMATEGAKRKNKKDIFGRPIRK
jgi:hypothetical protein